MAFLKRRRPSAQSQEQRAALGEEYDRLADLPLTDARAQEIRLAAEQRLDGGGWEMPAPWARLGFDYTNLREDVQGEEDYWAFTDGVVIGYVLRWVETERSDARAVPRDIAVRLGAFDPEDGAGGTFETILDVAATRLPEIRTLDDEQWHALEFWAWQFAAKRSRARRRLQLADAGIDEAPLPSGVNYLDAISFGYATRCCIDATGS